MERGNNIAHTGVGKLKPCLFCGGEVRLYQTRKPLPDFEDVDNGDYEIVCDRCNAITMFESARTPMINTSPCACKGYSTALEHTTNRHPDCPLVPVTKTHGRLGDLNRLAKEIKDMAKEFPPNSIGAERYRLFAEFIKTAPTIIQAEEGE